MKLDYFDQELEIGDYVLAAHKHELAVYCIIGFAPKMVRIAKPEAKTKKDQKGVLRYSKELFKIDPHLATFHIMRTKQE